jgi:hypothetical protein
VETCVTGEGECRTGRASRCRGRRWGRAGDHRRGRAGAGAWLGHRWGRARVLPGWSRSVTRAEQGRCRCGVGTSPRRSRGDAEAELGCRWGGAGATPGRNRGGTSRGRCSLVVVCCEAAVRRGSGKTGTLHGTWCTNITLTVNY